jgi:hypothetical protein
MSTSFREPAPETPKGPDEVREGSKISFEAELAGEVPVEDEQDLLTALGVGENVKAIPTEDYQDLQELKGYLDSFMEEKGLSKTMHGTQKALKILKEEVGLDEEADPQSVIKKIGSVARSWKEISFVRDLEERRKILIKLVGASSAKEMDKIVFDEMERRHVWR